MRDLRGRCTTRLRFRGNSLLGKVWESAECGWRDLPWRAAHDRRRQAATGGLYTRFPLALASKPLIINSLRSLLMVVWLCKPVLPSYFFFWSLIHTKWDVYIQHVRISVTSNMYVCILWVNSITLSTSNPVQGVNQSSFNMLFNVKLNESIVANTAKTHL